jgi:lysophospholipase L1-like esterase
METEESAMSDRDGAHVTSPQRLLRRASTALGILALALLLGEAALQLVALFASDRSSAWSPGARNRILCVGDSHTFGALVPRDQTYPAHLERFLAQREPGAYSVVNLGLPGMSTTQVRNRLPLWLSRYEPDVVIVWSGANDSWNVSELEDDAATLSTRLESLALRSRLYRLVRVRLHDLRLEADVRAATRPPVWEVSRVENPLGLEETWIVRRDGLVETFTHEKRGEDVYLDEAIVEARAERDYEAIVRYARAAGVGLVLISYPLDAGVFAAANRAMRSVTARHGVPLVDATVSLERIPPERRQWLWAGHPSGPIYREIARDVATRLLEPARR